MALAYRLLRCSSNAEGEESAERNGVCSPDTTRAGWQQKQLELSQLERVVAELYAVAIDLRCVARRGIMFTGVNADVVGFHSADLVATALLQVRQYLSATVDVLSWFVEIVAATESTPVIGSNLSGSDGTYV